jgi:hypothetical protein
MWILTWMLPRCSPEGIRDGDDRNFTDFGEWLQRRMAKIRRLNELQSNSFNRVAYLIMAELRGLLSWLGEPYSGDMKFTRARVSVTYKNKRERERERVRP